MVIGHQRISNFFKKSISNGRLAHAYLFSGPANLGKRALALELIRTINGPDSNLFSQPDVLIIEPQVLENSRTKREAEIGIDQARKIQHQMSLSPYSAPYKIALIDRAEMMTAEASNCLLKTLEEPTGKSVLILITASPNLLLSTIASRCQLIKFMPVPSDVILRELRREASRTTEEFRRKSTGSFACAQDDKLMEKIVQLANGRPGLAIEYLKNPRLIDEREQAIVQLEKLIRADLNERYQFAEKMSKDIVKARSDLACWLLWFRDLILSKIGCSDMVVRSGTAQYNDYSLAKIRKIIGAIKNTSKILDNPSFNSRLALEVLMLEL